MADNVINEIARILITQDKINDPVSVDNVYYIHPDRWKDALDDIKYYYHLSKLNVKKDNVDKSDVLGIIKALYNKQFEITVSNEEQKEQFVNRRDIFLDAFNKILSQFSKNVSQDFYRKLIVLIDTGKFAIIEQMLQTYLKNSKLDVQNPYFFDGKNQDFLMPVDALWATTLAMSKTSSVSSNVGSRKNEVGYGEFVIPFLFGKQAVRNKTSGADFIFNGQYYVDIKAFAINKEKSSKNIVSINYKVDWLSEEIKNPNSILYLFTILEKETKYPYISSTPQRINEITKIVQDAVREASDNLMIDNQTPETTYFLGLLNYVKHIQQSGFFKSRRDGLSSRDDYSGQTPVKLSLSVSIFDIFAEIHKYVCQKMIEQNTLHGMMFFDYNRPDPRFIYRSLNPDIFISRLVFLGLKEDRPVFYFEDSKGRDIKTNIVPALQQNPLRIDLTAILQHSVKTQVLPQNI